jgi:hypothetical protein
LSGPRSCWTKRRWGEAVVPETFDSGFLAAVRISL